METERTVPPEEKGAEATSTEVRPAPSPTEPQPAGGQVPEGARWYVVHTYTGYENKVKQNLEQRIRTMGVADKIFRVLVPSEEEIEIRDGQRRIVQRKIFPGYILVQMLLSDEVWHVVRQTPGVTGFVGPGNTPVPLPDHEVQAILKQMEAEAPKIRVEFTIGQAVRIVDGPFTDFEGVVDEIDQERGKVRVLVSFFGRETPIELDFMQIERIAP
jgi:transcriptional antiterminator NusG